VNDGRRASPPVRGVGGHGFQPCRKSTVSTEAWLPTRTIPPLGMTTRKLKQVPQELVVDLVMELNLRRFDDGAKLARTAIG
jgi:hypothetical protein